jgi:hypothetical protein
MALLLLLVCVQARAQFRDDFLTLKLDPSGRSGWRFRTGDGEATMRLVDGGEGYATILVDASKDKRNIWWAFIQREVSSNMNLGLLGKPGYEVRIEARIRASHAPRRVNLQIQTQRTTDYHSHLMEYDLPDTGWHTISMTTRDFDGRPGDTLIGHMALMDWGLSKYRVDVDHIKVDIVNVATSGPDLGAAVPYHPPVADPKSFAHAVKVAHDDMIDVERTDVDLNDWSDRGVRVVTVDGTHHVILRWDLTAFAGKRAAGSGLLELTTRAVYRKAETVKDFGLLRVVEVIGGSKSVELNPQMIIDWPASDGDRAKTYLTISQPVLQRLIDGKTGGIAVKALGAVSASFYAVEHERGRYAARLRFNVK